MSKAEAKRIEDRLRRVGEQERDLIEDLRDDLAEYIYLEARKAARAEVGGLQRAKAAEDQLAGADLIEV